MKFVPNGVTRIVATHGHKLSKHSPRILFIAGTVGVIGAGVLACRSTLKLEGLLHDMEIETNLLEAQGPERVAAKNGYSSRHFKKDQTILYTQHAARVTRLYAPALVLGLVSVACLTKSHTILSSRNANLTLAYAATEKALREYRGRVAAEFGEDKEREVYFAAEDHTIVEDTDKGPKKVTVKRPTQPGLYARFYDEFARNWQPDAEDNRIFIVNQERWANDKLQSQGYLFLNDVYKMLGLDITPVGQQVGWTLDGTGDGYVDFHLYDEKRNANFINGYENSVLLDFNVDGPILDKI